MSSVIFRVEVPQESASQFRAHMDLFEGARITFDQAKSLERETAKQHPFRQKLLEMLQPKDPQTEARIREGFQSMFDEVYGYNPKYPRLNLFRFTFKPAEPEEIHQARLQIHESIAKTVTPRAEYALAERFGLTDGDFKTYAQVGRLMGVSPNQASVLTKHVLRLLRDSHIRKLIEPGIVEKTENPEYALQ